MTNNGIALDLSREARVAMVGEIVKCLNVKPEDKKDALQFFKNWSDMDIVRLHMEVVDEHELSQQVKEQIL